MGSLNHENVVAIKEVTLWSDHIWIAMEMMSCSIFGLLCQISTGLPEEIAVFLVEEVNLLTRFSILKCKFNTVSHSTCINLVPKRSYLSSLQRIYAPRYQMRKSAR